jgi:hypothetical protein
LDGWLESVSVLGAAAPPLFLLLLLLLFLRPPSQLVRFVSVVLAVQAETSILRARKAFEAMDEHNKRLAAAAAAAERREALLECQSCWHQKKDTDQGERIRIR